MSIAAIILLEAISQSGVPVPPEFVIKLIRSMSTDLGIITGEWRPTTDSDGFILKPISTWYG
jgi:hypothetical protein